MLLIEIKVDVESVVKKISINDAHTHHINPKLPIDKVNKVSNLASTHGKCHRKIHDNKDYSHLEEKIWKKIVKFRNHLG